MYLTATLESLGQVKLFPERKNFRVELFFPDDKPTYSKLCNIFDEKCIPKSYIGSTNRALADLVGFKYLDGDEARTPTVPAIIFNLLTCCDTFEIEVKQKFFFGLFTRKRIIGGKYLVKNSTQVFTHKDFNKEERQATIEIFKVLGRLYNFEVIVDESCCEHSGNCCPRNDFKSMY